MRPSITQLYLTFILAAGLACSSTPAGDGTSGTGTGGSPARSGGAPGSGGSSSGGSGGVASGTGGSVAGTGGSASGTGGAVAGTGGSVPGTGGGSSPTDAAAPDVAPPTSGDAGPSAEGSHAQCPTCKPIFDGKTLDGWTPIGAEKWAVDNGAILSTGASAGVLVTTKAYDHYRLIYSWQMLAKDGHQANMVVFCRSASARYCGGVQFQPPGTDIWDYGPANKSLKGAAGLMKAPVEKGEAGQCEMIVNHTAGTFKVACCNLMGGKTCKAQPVGMLNYGKVPPGAFGWQAHNPDHKIRWWNIFVEENPTSDDFVTTK